MPEIPYGYCHCGCGQRTKVNAKTDHSRGRIAGEPRKYLYNHHLRNRPIAPRFWSKVDIRSKNECWNWKGKTYRASGTSYGLFYLNGKWASAHRVAYVLTHGEIPDGLCICHTCDNGLCCNPAHHFPGTRADNNHDKAMKGRGRTSNRRGILNTHARLTESAVKEIKRLAATGMMHKLIAQQLHTSPSNICRILQDKAWSHVK